MPGMRIMTVVLSALVFIGVAAAPFAAQAAETPQNINHIKYPADNWDPLILGFIEAGPRFLSRTEDIVVPPPPANDSPETRAELDLLLKYQAEARTPEEIQKIIDENTGKFDPIFDAKSTSIHEAVALGVNEINYFLIKAKKDYSRPRPTQLEPKLTTVIDIPKHAAYPSGHGTQARMGARVFSAIDPGRKDAYERYAREVALRREIAGLHYASDSKAATDLADAVFEKLILNPEYRKVLDAAIEEFKKIN